MATQPQHLFEAPQPRPKRMRTIGLAVALFLGLYAVGLAVVTRYVEAGVEKSIQPLPVVMQARDAQPG